ncbi:MAG: hypothetical protein LBI37_00365 [Puniceicoccales bacterium]|jgi:3-phytase|nr:hypothetical protein [Puniceicoccales bacterium]
MNEYFRLINFILLSLAMGYNANACESSCFFDGKGTGSGTSCRKPNYGKLNFNIQNCNGTYSCEVCYKITCCDNKCEKTNQDCKKKCKNKNMEKRVELWMTPQNHSDNLDSVACADNKIYVTAKSEHMIHIYDARNGVPLGKFGGKGNEFGQFNRPNGIATMDNLLFVTERDNSRVQVFSLPNCSYVCTFGEDTLVRPYGIFTCKINGYYLIYVTDDGKAKKSENDNARRIVVFIMDEEMNQIDPKKFEISDEFGVGEFGKLESIYGDLESYTLLIADEKSNELKLYSMDGKSLNKKISSEFFSQGDPEGVWFFKKDGRSYWLAVEQRRKKTTIFHLFDAKTLNHLRSFSGIYTKNTDGICINETDNGLVLYAVNDDQAVTAFSLDFL